MDRERHEAPQEPRPVLLVTEDDLFARTVQHWLDRRGWAVTRAPRAGGALDLWRECGAAVALVDLDDDGLTGLSLLSAAQSLDPPGRAVIASRDPGAARIPEPVRRRLGIEGLALRPCHVEEVERLLRQACGLEGARAGSAS
jgi:ActR/RegA family two-component response regulator